MMSKIYLGEVCYFREPDKENLVICATVPKRGEWVSCKGWPFSRFLKTCFKKRVRWIGRHDAPTNEGIFYKVFGVLDAIMLDTAPRPWVYRGKQFTGYWEYFKEVQDE